MHNSLVAIKNAPGSTKVSAKSINPRKRPQASAIGVVGYLLGFISQTKVRPPTPKSRSPVFPLPRCPLSENPELTHVVRQFIEANRAVNEEGKEF